MEIKHYSFGRINIDGRDFDSDVIIFPERVQDNWWRSKGHQLDKDDLRNVLEDKPDILVIGTGYYGRMQVPNETLEALQSKGVKVCSYRTAQAVREFNRLQKEYASIVAALHLTC